MKKIIKLFIFSILIVILSSCNNYEDITFQTSDEMNIGNNYEYSCNYKNEEIEINYDQELLQIKDNLITPIKEGNTEIIIKLKKDEKIFLKHAITITNNVTITYQDNDVEKNVITKANEEIILDVLSKEGYIFIGWSLTSDLKSPMVKITTDKNVTLYSVWEKLEKRNITYYLNQGTLNNAVRSYQEGQELLLQIPTREGYFFNGWYEEAGYQGEKIEKISSNERGNKSYYASWEVNVINDRSEDYIINNVIFIIGDGMGFNQVELAKKYYDNLALDTITNIGEVTTYCLGDDVLTDSAAAGTAYATASKTKRGIVGLDINGNYLENIIEFLQKRNFKTGIVTSKPLNDATPAAFSSHVLDRYDYETDIITQQINSDIDLLFGGNLLDFNKQIDLINKNGYYLAKDKKTLNSFNGKKIMGLFAQSDMKTYLSSKPNFVDMSSYAIDFLSGQSDNFFLMIEEGMIDYYCGQADPKGVANRVKDLDDTVKYALDYAKKDGKTLVVVIADHETGGLVIKEGDPDKSWFTSEDFYHTDVNVPIYAYGPGSEYFNDKILDNTEVMPYIASLLGYVFSNKN